MNWELLTPVFIEFQNMFQNAMKELFVNKCICEEISLYFFVLEFLQGSKQIYFIREADEKENIAANGEQNVNRLIHKSMEERIGDKEYIQSESDPVTIDGQMCKIIWIISSECMEQGRGRFLFRCVCEALTDDFNRLLQQMGLACDLEEIRQLVADWRGHESYYIQRSIREASAKACLYLQTLYAPLSFPFIVKLSGEYYERSECRSNMIFLPQIAADGMTRADFLYCFDDIQFDEIHVSEILFIPKQIRLIRKLLQIAQQELCLVLGEDADRHIFKVLGICKESLFYDKSRQFPYAMVRFRNHMQWDMLLNGTYIFSYKNGQYNIEDKIHKTGLIRKLYGYFGESAAGYELPAEVVTKAVQQEHGTMIIIMSAEDAHREVGRLGQKQYGLPAAVPESLTDDIRQLSNIDGSVIMDTAGRIHGIGMILDGVVSGSGSLARGARYNSAVKYSEYLRESSVKAMFFIISEDRTVDILCC